MNIDKELLDKLEAKWKGNEKPLPVDDDLKEQVVESLSVEEISFLKPHEETHLIGKLRVAEGILKEKKFTWPIFADRKTGVILDGMHRFGLLKDFCFSYIPVQHIDYVANDDIKLDVWCRYIKQVSEDEFSLVAKECGLEEVPFSTTDIMERKSAIIVSPNNRAYIFHERHSPQIEYYRLKEVEDRFSIGKKVSTGLADYNVETEALGMLNSPDTVVVFPRPLSKQDVIDVAMRGEVFPPKTTRHIFQFRVFNIEVLPTELQATKTKKALEDAIWRAHKKRKLFYLGKGIIIDRYYAEHMFRFS